MPRKVRELIAELERAGFETRSGKGSHRIFIHKNCPFNIVISGGAPPAGAGGSFPKSDIPRLAESIHPPAGVGGVLQRGKSGADALPYQEKAIKRALREIKK